VNDKDTLGNLRGAISYAVDHLDSGFGEWARETREAALRDSEPESEERDEEATP
jgi:hypothetical protein